jgi:hypothetical protein
VVRRHVLLPSAGVVPHRGKPVTEIHVAVYFRQTPAAVFSYRKEIRGGEDLVEQLLAPGRPMRSTGFASPVAVMSLMSSAGPSGNSTTSSLLHRVPREGVVRSEASMGTKREAVQVWLLGGFRVSAGSRTVEEDVWRLKEAAALV